MLTFILLLIAGSFFAYVSQFNLMPVSVNLGWYILSDIPLFFVIIVSFLIGLVLSYLVLLVHKASAFFAIRGKSNQIKETKMTVLELTKRVHQLEIENEKLKQRAVAEPFDRHSL